MLYGLYVLYVCRMFVCVALCERMQTVQLRALVRELLCPALCQGRRDPWREARVTEALGEGLSAAWHAWPMWG